MARLWEDGFDHYGDNEADMLDGSYGTVDCTLITSPTPPTGTHAVAPGISGTDGIKGIRRVLQGAARDKVGAAARFYFPGLPDTNTVSIIFDFLSASANRSHVSCFVDSNGRLLFRTGANHGLNGGVGTQIAVSDPVITANAWNHVEVQVYKHATLGWVRAAVNGIHVFEATNLDTEFDSSGIISVAQVRSWYGGATISNGGPFYMDDYYIYDFVGDSAVDTDFCPTTDGGGMATGYIGELQVMLRMANGDTAEADWLKSTGTEGFSLIDEVPSNDADYVYSLADTDLSEFEIEDLPEEITYIRGVGIHSRISKSDAGAAMYRVGMKSDIEVSDAAERPMTIEPTYWRDEVNVDPDSGARWTRASFNAAWLRIRRTI